MCRKKILLVVLLFSASVIHAQKNFTYTPEKPKPGDVISFTYESSGDLANSLEPIEAIVYSYDNKGGRAAEDLPLKRKGYKYTVTIVTDTLQNLISISFYVGKRYDTNLDSGYYIQLYDNDKPKKEAMPTYGSFINLLLPHQV